MEANLSFEKKSGRAPLTEGCCRLPFPCVRPSASTAPSCCSSRQTWISARPLYSVVQLLICSRPFQSKNSNVRGGGGGGGQGEARRKGKKEKREEQRGKRRRDKHASSLRSKEVASSEQAMSALWPSSKGGWPRAGLLLSVHTETEGNGREKYTEGILMCTKTQIYSGS